MFAALKTRKVLLILLALLLLGLFAGLLLVRQRQELRRRAAPATSLSIVPASLSKNPGESISFVVQADTGENQVTGFDLELAYDPTAVEITQVRPGSAASAFTQILNKIDPGLGRALYSAYNLDTETAVRGTGQLAQVSGKVKEGAAAGNYLVGFGPNTAVSAAKEGQNVLVSTASLSLSVLGEVSPSPSPGASPTPSPTPSPSPSPSPSPQPTPTPQAQKPTVNLSAGQKIKSGETITGTAEPNSLVTITISSHTITAQVRADAQGRWSYTLPASLEEGEHTITITDTKGTTTLAFNVESPVATLRASPSPSPPIELPQAGVSIPTVMGVGVGVLLLLLGFALAL